MKKAKSVQVPILGRYLITPDRHGSGELNASTSFIGHLTAQVFDKDGNERMVKDYFGSNKYERIKYRMLYRDKTTLDLGTGLVTNIGVAAMSNDWNLASPSAAAINTLKLANWHITGTGTTAAAATDFKIQTISTAGGQTPTAGTQSIDTTSTMAVPKYKTVATISYTGTEAVTEWALICGSTVSSTTGTPFTGATATTFTATATPFTASSTTVQGLQQQVVIPGTTTVMGLITSNTTSVGTLWNNGTTGWFTQAAQTAGSTPGTTEAYTLRPVTWDHKVFSAINVSSGDSIVFTYLLTVNSGG